MEDRVRAELQRLGEGSSTVGQENRLLRALFYGDFGSGKTTLALHCIENKGIWVTTDSAWVVVDKYPALQEKVYRYPFTGFEQIRAFCEAKVEGIEPWASADTLIWDTCTGSLDTFLYRILNDPKMKFNDQRHDEVPSWTHYGIMQRKLRETVDSLSKSDYNVIYLAHLREPTEEDRKKKHFALRANAPEASYNIIAREVQLIGWMHKEGKGLGRQVQFEGTLREAAKSQVSTIQEDTYPVEQVPELIRKWKTR